MAALVVPLPTSRLAAPAKLSRHTQPHAMLLLSLRPFCAPSFSLLHTCTRIQRARSCVAAAPLAAACRCCLRATISSISSSSYDSSPFSSCPSSSFLPGRASRASRSFRATVRNGRLFGGFIGIFPIGEIYFSFFFSLSCEMRRNSYELNLCDTSDRRS